mgnify:CR=1 FL=1
MSSPHNENISTTNTNENKEEKIINKEKDIFQLKEELNDNINYIQSNLLNYIEDDKLKKSINHYLCEISKIIDILINSLNSVIKSKKEFEALQRKDEHKIRVIYSQYFHQKLVNEVLENKINTFYKKEKEYEILKEKTGAIICNGKVICNERKDNEIIILRTENSLLKSTIANKEDLIKEKTDLIDNLNKEILSYKTKMKGFDKIIEGDEEYPSFPNINISINEAKQSNTKRKTNKPIVNSIKFRTSSKKSNIDQKSVNYNKKNSSNNIYSTYQNNSKLLNKPKNFIKNKDEFLKFNKLNNISKNTIKYETIDSSKTNNSIKYISVNKSLMSPRNNIKIKSKNNVKYNEKSRQMNKVKKNTFKNSNNNSNLNNSIKSNESQTKKKNEIKNKKNIVNNNIINVKHRKAYSIQYHENSLKKMIINRRNKERSQSNEKMNNKNNNSYNLFSVLKKISEIKNKSLRKNSPGSSSLTSTISENCKHNKHTNSQKYFNPNIIMSYSNKNNKGRNENYELNKGKIMGSSNKDNNSINSNGKACINKTFISKDIKDVSENYSINEK